MKKRRLNEDFKARYEIVKELVSDPSGALVLANDGNKGQQVAIKFLSRETLANNGRQLIEQARTLQGLHHENIVKVLAVEPTGEHPYITFEHIECDTLSSILEGLGALPIKLAVKWAMQLADGLECSHANGLLHGDLTSDTILISSEEKIKVTDFGYVRRLEHRTHYTATGVVQGTPGFMAPELALGDKPGHSADLYAAGVILFQMLTARMPFAGSTAADVLLAHVRVPAPNPSSLRPGISRELSEVVLKAMAKKPSERFVSFRDFKESLKALTIEEDEVGRRARLLRKRNLGPDDSGEHDPEAGKNTRRMLAVSFGNSSANDPEEGRTTAKIRPPTTAGPPEWEKSVRIRARSSKVTCSWKTLSRRIFCYSVTLSSLNEVVITGEEAEGTSDHSIEVSELQAGTTYLLRIWDERDYLERKFKTPVAAL